MSQPKAACPQLSVEQLLLYFFVFKMACFTGELSIADIQELLTATVGTICGTDSEDRMYDSIEGLWSYELDNSKKCKKGKKSGTKEELAWYTDAYDYWESEENCPISDDGVLGGFGALTPMDVRDSNAFIDLLLTLRPGLKLERVADCGAGIGRVTKNLLLPRCGVVDLVEQSPRLIAAAPAYCGETNKDRLNLITIGLQDFSPAPGTYDLIWIQWVIGHLHDLDFISFFRRCAVGLKPGGVIVLKDNCVADYTFAVDKSDSSVARHADYIHLLFHLSGLKIVAENRQKDFPPELYPVLMFALAPIDEDAQK